MSNLMMMNKFAFDVCGCFFKFIYLFFVCAVRYTRTQRFSRNLQLLHLINIFVSVSEFRFVHHVIYEW